MLTVQDPFAAMEVPQLLVCANGPVTPIDDTDAAVVLGLETVTVCALLVDPTAWFPKDRLDGDADSGLLVPPPPDPGKTWKLRQLRGAPAGVGGEAQLHVPGAGP